MRRVGKPALENPRTATRGFTLVEVLIALAIVPLVLAVAFSVVSVALRAYQVIRTRSELSADGMRAMESIGQDLRGATEVYSDSSETRLHGRLQGGADEVDYEHVPPSGEDPGALTRNGTSLFGPETSVASCEFGYLAQATDPDAPPQSVDPQDARSVRVVLELSRGQTSMTFESVFGLRNL